MEYTRAPTCIIPRTSTPATSRIDLTSDECDYLAAGLWAGEKQALQSHTEPETTDGGPWNPRT